MIFKTTFFSGLIFFSVFLLSWNFSEKGNLSENVGHTTRIHSSACQLDVSDDLEIQLGESAQIEAIASCPASEIATLVWEPTDYLSCADCMTPIAQPLDDQCYTLTINWNDGCVSTDQVCVFVRSCDALFSENKVNSVTPAQIGDQAAIELEIARTQFVHIEIVENDEIQFNIWEGWLKAGLRNVFLDFSSVPIGSHELRVRLYPEDKTIDIEKL